MKLEMEEVPIYAGTFTKLRSIIIGDLLYDCELKDSLHALWTLVFIVNSAEKFDEKRKKLGLLTIPTSC